MFLEIIFNLVLEIFINLVVFILKMKKRGQVTIFMILGIFVLITVFSFVFLNNYTKTKQLEQDVTDGLELNLNSERVNNAVTWCINDIGGKAILNLGAYGGKQELVGNFFDEELFDANYLYYFGEKQTSSIEEMEDSLSIMMEEHLEDCVDKLTKKESINVEENIVNHDLIFESFQVDKGKINTSTEIIDEAVMFTVNWPLKLKFRDQEKEISNFPTKKIEVDLNRTANFVEDFVERLQVNPYFIDVVYLLKQNYTIDLTMLNNDTYVFLITDNNSIINHEPLKFLWAAKLNNTGVLI